MPLDLNADLASLVGERPLPGPRCAVAKLLDGVGEHDAGAAENIIAALDNDDVIVSKLASTLARHGHSVSTQSLLRHKRRSTPNGCRCAK